MPTSDPKILTPVATEILNAKPIRVLDIGVGYGKWGAIAREYTDIWWWRFYRNEWKVTIDGIEGFEKYRSPNWDHYTTVHIGEIQNVLPTLGDYDLILMLEVLEHLPKEEALGVLEDIFQRTKHAIISYTNTEQKNVRDNALEDHVSKWELSEFMEYGTITVLHEDSDGAVLSIRRG